MPPPPAQVRGTVAAMWSFAPRCSVSSSPPRRGPGGRAGLWLGLGLAACTQGSGTLGSSTPADVRFAPAEPGPLQEVVLGDQAVQEPAIFRADVLHTIAVELPAESVEGLGADPYEKVPGHVILDGVPVQDVGVRLRGKIGSFRDLSGKPKLELDFNAFAPGRRYDGLKSLSLNNSIVDCSFVKEPLAYAVFEAIGAPAVRTSYATLTVNGSDYGLYIVVETQDDRFVEANWADPSGNLYDGKYVWYGGRDYLLLDFGDGNDHEYQLEEGEDVGHADISAVSDALLAAWGQPDFYARMGEVLDWDATHRVWAGEEWVGQNDGYCLNQNNYRVYFDPEDGKADLIPWDMDYSFLRDSDWGRDWRAPAGHLALGCFQDPTCRAAHRDVVADLLDVVDTLDLEGQLDDHLALISDAADADPRRECARGDLRPWQDYVDWWLGARSGMVATRWGL